MEAESGHWGWRAWNHGEEAFPLRFAWAVVCGGPASRPPPPLQGIRRLERGNVAFLPGQAGGWGRILEGEKRQVVDSRLFPARVAFPAPQGVFPSPSSGKKKNRHRSGGSDSGFWGEPASRKEYGAGAGAGRTGRRRGGARRAQGRETPPQGGLLVLVAKRLADLVPLVLCDLSAALFLHGAHSGRFLNV